jgi:hypothetical protein
MALYNNVPKGGDIKCPAIRYLYYIIANTVRALNEFTRVNKEDMLVLAKAAIPECNMMPNLGAILLFYLDCQAVQTHGPIVCGKVATVLANALNIPLGNIFPLADAHLLGFRTLRCCHMVSKVNGRYVVHIPRAEHTYPTPVPHYLFSIEDGWLHYDAQVEQDHPEEQDDDEEVPEHDDEVE